MNARTEMPDFPDYPLAQLRVPPHSLEAESTLLGGLMLHNSLLDHIGDIVTEKDFYRFEHQQIFAVMSELIMACKPADIITVFERLKGKKEASSIDLGYLSQLAQYVPSTVNARRYAEIVRDRAMARRLIAASDEIATMGFNSEEPMEVRLAKASALLDKVNDEAPRDDWEDTATGMVRLLDRVQAQCDGSEKPDFVPFGLKELDDRLDGGGRPGELIIIGARPSMGKSALALGIGVHVALHEGLPVGLISMEMPKAQVHARMTALIASIHLSKIKRPERLNDIDWSSLSTAVEKLRCIPFFTSDTSSLNINKVRIKARSLQRRNGLRVLIVDYLGLMEGTDNKAPRTYQLEEVTKGLKQLAKEMGITVLLLAQVGRGVEQRPDQMPILSDLRDSGAIEQDADIVLFVHREAKAKQGLGKEWEFFAECSIAKARDGQTGRFPLMYVGQHTRFMDWPEDMQTPRSLARTSKVDL